MTENLMVSETLQSEFAVIRVGREIFERMQGATKQTESFVLGITASTSSSPSSDVDALKQSATD